KVNELKHRIETLNPSRSNPDYKQFLGGIQDAELVKGLEQATGELTVEQSRLNTMQEKAIEIRRVLELAEQRRIELTRQEKERQD
ncbi:hypothetical protein KKJ04_25365, partial [Xenorhabdus bovienii]|uniref:phage tail tape measure protein n=1 Tax=Xenorhabdus bovienii TaxID=40576 RepID=UPI0023B324E5